MAAGYIYVLQNPAYGRYAIKIGLTTRLPDVRARELYSGSSGVPLEFSVAVAYSVGDCKVAERQIHKRLKAFRMNNRREFFRSSPAVASAIVYETCCWVNTGLGLPSPAVFRFSARPSRKNPSKAAFRKSEEHDLAETREVRWIDPREVRDSPLGTSILSAEQIDRAGIICMQMAQVFPEGQEKWHESFSRDSNPESELRIWEHITKAYLTVEEVEFASDALKFEAFELLLMRSMSPTSEVLERMSLKHFSPKSAKRLLQAYELKPKPLRVTWEKT
jgi:hypothetical protein